jgi:hypothetical protein
MHHPGKCFSANIKDVLAGLTGSSLIFGDNTISQAITEITSAKSKRRDTPLLEADDILTAMSSRGG